MNALRPINRPWLWSMVITMCFFVLFLAATHPAISKPVVAPGINLDVGGIAGGARWYILQASIHFDNPFEQLLTLNRTVTEQRANGYVVTSWTFFGIPLERALVEDRGGIQTL